MLKKYLDFDNFGVKFTPATKKEGGRNKQKVFVDFSGAYNGCKPCCTTRKHCERGRRLMRLIFTLLIFLLIVHQIQLLQVMVLLLQFMLLYKVIAQIQAMQ